MNRTYRLPRPQTLWVHIEHLFPDLTMKQAFRQETAKWAERGLIEYPPKPTMTEEDTKYFRESFVKKGFKHSRLLHE